MGEAVAETSKAQAVALTTARLERVLQETRRDEARLKRILETRRLSRRVQAVAGRTR